jgi:hypothetical protein
MSGKENSFAGWILTPLNRIHPASRPVGVAVPQAAAGHRLLVIF